jgi:glycosyltransferase involved in cell wall biosynthesis
MNESQTHRATGGRPPVSIIVPVYEVEAYLEQCLDSLVGQSLPGIEIILIDDGSRDGSSAIVDRYAKEHPAAIRACRVANGGPSSARNLGITMATGEYIGFVDGDDWVDKEMFKALYEEAVNANSEVVVCGIRRHSDELQDLKPFKLKGSFSDYGTSVAENPRILLSVRAYTWNKLYRRGLWIDNGLKFPPGQWYEDSAVVYNALRLANRISYVPACLYSHRVDRIGSATHAFSPKIFDIFKSCDEIIRFDRENPIDHPEMSTVLEVVVRDRISARFGVLKARRTREERLLAWKFLKSAFSYLDQNFPGWRVRWESSKPKRPKAALRVCRGPVSTYVFAVAPRWMRAPFTQNRQEQRRRARKALKRTYKAFRKKLERLNFRLGSFGVLEKLDDAIGGLPTEYFVDSATLLGLVRDGRLLPHERGLDIGVIATDEQKLEVDDALQDADFRLKQTHVFEGRVVQCSYDSPAPMGRKPTGVNIAFYEVDTSRPKTWLFYLDPNIQLGPLERSVVEICHSPVSTIVTIEVDSHTIPIPEDAEQFLRDKYGECWRASSPNPICCQSPAAVPLKSVGSLVRGAGGIRACGKLAQQDRSKKNRLVPA